MAGKSRNKTNPLNKNKSLKSKSYHKSGKDNVLSEEEKKLKNEIILWIILGICIFLLLSNLGLAGKVGNWFSQFAFGLFGVFNFILPVVLFVAIAFDISNKNNRLIHLKIIAEIIIILLVCTFIQMLTTEYNKEVRLIDYYKISSANKSGGGIIGGTIADILIPTFGTAGTYVFLIIFFIICIVVITEKSVLKGVKNSSSKVYQTAKEDSIRRKEKSLHNKEARALKKEKRIDKVVKGVATNTIIKEKISIGDEIHEITEDIISEVIPEETSWFTDEEQLVSENTDTEIKQEEEVIKKSSKTKEDKNNVKETPEVKEADTIEIKKNQTGETKKYIFPPINLLKRGQLPNSAGMNKQLKETAFKLQKTLGDFGVGVTITNVSRGPAVTRYELQPEHGVKVSKIVSLSDDIKLNLAAPDIRIEAPIPGKAAIGIEVPNKENTTVMLRDLLEDEAFKKHSSNIAFAVGKDISGQVIVADIAKMPHLLIAGATGSGKSVCINTIILSILYKSSPEDVKIIMIDPKVVELSVYNGIPHLFIPVVTDPKKAAGALNWAVAEMSDRYKKFAELNVRDLKGYNEKIKSIEDIDEENKPEKLPQIVIIVDELADLMMVAPGEVEDAICRLAQLARAAGLHLILATQRPSVNVITGLIKANMPSRIAFSVSSGVDSRTIIDMNGAEKLLGKGDMLFYPTGYQKPARIQGAFVSDNEVSQVVEFLTNQYKEVAYSSEIEEKINSVQENHELNSQLVERDAYFVEAGKFIIEKDKASIGMLQRVFRVGFNRAARIMDQLCEAGVVGEEEGTKPRKVLMTMEEFEEYIDEYV